MFEFGSTPESSMPNAHKMSYPQTNSPQHYTSPTESFQAAIDGPPSPERIRAYTEQMKRSSMFGNQSRTHHFSSAPSSLRVGGSNSDSTESLSLSRKSSIRSNASSMYTGDSDGSQRLGMALFSRTARKLRRESGLSNVGSAPFSSSGNGGGGLGGLKEEELSARDRYHSKVNTYFPRPGTSGSMMSSKSRKQLQISAPTNFQHVTHTRQEQLPNLQQTSRNELVSEFTAIRASQLPTRGELKGIRAESLHSEQLSPDILKRDSTMIHRLSPERHRETLRQVNNNSPPSFVRTRSHDRLRQTLPPPRPPRSPLHPQELPLRTSSRTASTVIEDFYPFAQRMERPKTSGGFRQQSLRPLVSPPGPVWSEQQQNYFEIPALSHAVTTPGDEAWPLTTSTLEGNAPMGVNILPEEEEEEIFPKQQARRSIASGELRLSQSVPALRIHSRDSMVERPETGMSTTSGNTHDKVLPDAGPSPTTKVSIDESWEDDIDYCYEHEVEADFDYEWERRSLEVNRNCDSSPVVEISPLNTEYKIHDTERAYRGLFRPSLLVPTRLEVPELSPLSQVSNPESDPQTPSSTLLRPNHFRTASYASSFKESHGFTLSPSLLIPVDFSAAMDHERAYEELDQAQPYSSGAIYARDSYQQLNSPIEESTSSTASYRSSAFSRISPRSSSSTRLSARSHASQESLLLLNAGNISQAHRSIGSASSLPDLIPSSHQKAKNAISLTVGGMTFSANTSQDDIVPSPIVPSTRRKNSLLGEQGPPNSLSISKALLSVSSKDTDVLSPVAEFALPLPKSLAPTERAIHGRKSSAPLLGSTTPAEKEHKGRARSATTTMAGHSKTRSKGGSYMLFPSTS